MPSPLEYEFMSAALCGSAAPRGLGVLLVDEFKRLWGPNGSGGHSRLDFGPMRIDGIKVLGSTLTATLVGGFATGFQWYRTPGGDIAGATDIRTNGTQSQYVLTALDLAAGVEVSLRATDFVPTASAGVASAVAPTTSAPITISAAAQPTNPRFGYAPALLAGNTSGLASLFTSMTDLTGSASAGRAGTFNTVSSVTNFTWIAVLQSAAGASVRIFDGTGYGGFSGAGASGLYAPGESDPTTIHLTYTDGSGNVWNMYRSDSKAVTYSTFTLS